MEKKYITVKSEGNMLTIATRDILYVEMTTYKPEICLFNGERHSCRSSLEKLQDMLGDGFLRVSRNCLVSVRAVHDIEDEIILCNGETLPYTKRNKTSLKELLQAKKKIIINRFAEVNQPKTEEEYHEYYQSFDHMPFAFTDIEMVFDDNRSAIDWIFRYGNEALARLEKVPLGELIGQSFGSIFENMDQKWLRSYEQVALYGESIEIIDYSPEIDTYLQVTCFPTFPGHCGCILRDLEEIKYAKGNSPSERALLMHLECLAKVHK